MIVAFTFMQLRKEAYFTQLHKLRSLRRSFLHFHTVLVLGWPAANTKASRRTQEKYKSFVTQGTAEE